MKNFVVAISLFCIVILNSGCPKSSCIKTNYSFAVNSQISPDLDSIRLGDTLYLTSSFPKKLVDDYTKTVVDYSNSMGIGSTLGLVKLVNGSYPGKDAVNSFKYSNVTGSVYNDKSIPSPDKIQQLKYDEVNDNYKLKIGIIPMEKGVYYLGVGNGLSNGRNKSNSCEKASFNITMINTSQHLNYFSAWNPNGTLSTYEKDRAYFFKVY
ncbi:hypothetical protein [Mucilaginibacter sp.]|uniref:hypothetical protein n=1 Tax=Mucilaginibacter sp. TaxID=1882438 RepID=UPI003B00E86C